MRTSIFLNWSSCVFGSPLSRGVLNLGQWHVTGNGQCLTRCMMGRVGLLFDFTSCYDFSGNHCALVTWNTYTHTVQNTNSLICHWHTCPGQDRGSVHKQEMPPKPAQSWCGCHLLVARSVGIQGPWRGRPHRVQVRSADTYEGTKSLTVRLRQTHRPAGTYTYADISTQHIHCYRSKSAQTCSQPHSQWQTDTQRVTNRTGALRDPLNLHPRLESSFNLFPCSF